MIPRSPFLAVPIRALVAADGSLVEADPPLRRLHLLAGGEVGGQLAIAGLAAFAERAARTKMPTQGPVVASDEEHDVELWVETGTIGDMVELLVTGWREIATPRRDDRREASISHSEATANAILVDPDGRIISIANPELASLLGRKLHDIIAAGSPSGNATRFNQGSIPSGEVIELQGNLGRYEISLSPHHDAQGTLAGYVGSLQRCSPAEGHGDVITAMPLGRQFASVLKQPLSRIMANAETIGGRLRGPLQDNYAEYALDIATAARHLSELVADMEDLEAIDRPDFVVAKDKIELGDIARRVVGLLALKASDHGMEIILPKEGDRVDAVGEFRRVLQIMLNLVGNAIRYTPDGSHIEISISRADDIAMISVADQGSGVPVEHRERIFDKFERLGRSGDGGSGLGLFISRKLARAMGGDLIVSSAPQGGALFTLSLPAR